MKFVDLISHGALWMSSTYLNYHFINVSDVQMAKDSKCSM